MAETEERCGAARGDSPSARHQIGCALLGIAAAVAFLVDATAASGQEGGLLPGAPAGGAGAAPDAFGGPQAPAAGPAPADVRGREWTITPSISGTETFNDNVFYTAHQRQADLISTLSPSLFINGESARLTGVFSYSPQLIKYANFSSEDQILQNLLGTGTLTAVQDLLFIDASASISNIQRSGGRGFNNQAPIPTSQNTQSIAYTLSPYARFHFGSSGDAEVRYSISQTQFDGNTGATVDTVTGQTLGAISNSTQQSESARYSTGEAFARLQFTFVLDNVTTQNSGSSLNSRDTRANANGSYALGDHWAALFGAGYETLTFSQQSNLDFRGPTWNVGARWTPREDRSVQLTYGKSQGQDSFNALASYAVGGRTVLSGSYTETTTTQQQQLLANLATATQLTPGVTIDKTTGLPVFIINPNLALQDSIIRSKNLQLGALITGIRNRVSVSINRSELSGLTTGSLSQTTNGGFVSWSRDLSPDTTGIVSASYSTTSSPGTTNGSNSVDAATLSVSLSYSLSDTLTGAASYALSHQSGGVGGAILVDLVSVSLRKSF